MPAVLPTAGDSTDVEVLDTVIVGGGHAGLVLSCLLQDAGRSHAVLEKGRALEQWRSARWAGFKLNTPMAYSRLPGQRDHLEDTTTGQPQSKVLASWESHVAARGLPVRERTSVVSVTAAPPGGGGDDPDWLYVTAVETGEDGSRVERILKARNVVGCSGAYGGKGRVPAGLADGAPAGVVQLKTGEYRSPAELPEGAVLVIGGAQSGMQIAHELTMSGKEVYIATSKVKCSPRTLRGEDVFFWMDRSGFLRMPTEAAPPPLVAAHNPITGADHPISHHDLARKGAHLLGRFTAFEASEDGSRVLAKFANNLKENVEFGEQGYHEICGMFDKFAREVWTGPKGELATEPEWEERYQLLVEQMEQDQVPTELDMTDANVTTVIWATGWECNLSYAPEAVRKSLNAAGKPTSMQSAVDGFFFLGFPWLRHCQSANIVGHEYDAQELLGMLRPPVEQA